MADYRSVVTKTSNSGFIDYYLLRRAKQKQFQEQYFLCLLGFASNILPQTLQVIISLRRRDLLAHSGEQYL